MRTRYRHALCALGLVVVALLGAACLGQRGGTEVIPFDPGSIARSENQPLLGGTCEASVVVPRAGAYKCALSNGGTGDPCFVVEDNILICGPNPVHGSYQAMVEATMPLPQAIVVADKAVPFYLDLGLDKPPCAKRAEPLEISGQAATYACQAPGAWIVGEPDTSKATWVAQYITTDTQATQITYGPEASDVVRAWVH